MFPTRSDTIQALQPQKMAKGLKFQIYEVEDCTIGHVAKTKVLIRCAVTAQLICAFVLTYAKSRFSHDLAHFKSLCIAFRNLKMMYLLRSFRPSRGISKNN